MHSFSVLSWNTMGRPWHGIAKTKIDRVSREKVYAKMMRFLEKTPADIICLQEAAEYFDLGMEERLKEQGYIWRNKGREKQSNVIVSKFPCLASGSVLLEKKVEVRPRKMVSYPSTCSWMDCRVGESRLRVYNCQFRIRGIGIQERLLFLEKILKHAQAIPYPVILCGDMNTIIPQHGLKRRVIQFLHNERKKSMMVDGKYHASSERQAFLSLAEKSNFLEVLNLDQTTWAMPYTSWELFRLKLDWFLIRNLECREYRLGSYITDHRPILVELTLH